MSSPATQEKQTRALEVLHANVEALRSSDQWKAALDVRAKLHRYSFANTMLIALQCPDATMVAGYRAWQNDFNRQVRKGESSIAILAPIIKKVDDEDSDEKKRICVGFRTASVFDISQTDGEPVPEAPRPQILDGHDETAQSAFARLCAYAEGIGSPIALVERDVLGSAQGCYIPSTKEIKVANDLPALQTLKTAVHEVAHALVHADRDARADRAIAELEAESAAYLVCDALGIDTGSYSFAYVAGWMGDPEDLLKSGDRAVKASTAIIEALETTTPQVAS